MLNRLILGAALLVLPLAALLFAQWPLREWVQAGSREANDLGQIVFALYMAVAVTAASRARSHLAAGHTIESTAPWRSWAVLACVAPWALFLLITTAPGVWRSMISAEHFAETLNPGYFVIKMALWLLAALALLDAAGQAWKSRRIDE